jgi:hypothetical protein
MPAQFLLFGLFEQIEQYGGVRINFVGPGTRDYLQTVGCSHTYSGVSIEQAFDQGRKMPSIMQDQLYDILDSTDHASIPKSEKQTNLGRALHTRIEHFKTLFGWISTNARWSRRR